MTLVAVSPVDRERLVPLAPALIIDATGETVAQVVVNGVITWNGISGQNGWMALTVSFTGGTRLVLDPPTPFTVGQVVNVVVGGTVTMSMTYLFQCGLRQITTSDDAGEPRVTETSSAPWVAYSRDTGNIYLRKDDPLTAETLTVPGDRVDIGHDDVAAEIEVVYIHNSRVFLIAGADTEVPSTLTQPSILKSDMKTGDVGDSPRHTHSTVNFTPLKYAAPLESTVTGDVGDSPMHTFGVPPSSPIAFAFLGPPTVVIIAPVSSTLITSVRLFKRNTGAHVLMATFPYSVDLQSFVDPTYVEGDRYFTQSVYGDLGAPAMPRLTPRSTDSGATYGDLITTGSVGDSPQHTHSTVTYPPMKYAVPTDGPAVTGDVGHTGEHGYVRGWYPPSGVAASMSTAVAEHLVITGLVAMSVQHIGLDVTISGAATGANNGAWRIVEILGTTSVRVHAPGAPGGDGNNGALTWSVTGPTVVTPASFIIRNTLNIGVGA